MKILIACPRDYDDYFWLERALDEFMSTTVDEIELISGDLGDATCLIEKYALEHRLPYTKYLPNWYRDGDQANVYVTNRMLDECAGPGNICIAFMCGRTKYVKDLIQLATQRRMSVLKIVR